MSSAIESRAISAGRQKDGKTFQVVSFRLGAEEYGINIMLVQEIILIGHITQVPEVPSYVLGVINLRGNVISIIDLRQRFGMPMQQATDDTRIVVTNLHGRTVGFVVDGVSEVLRLQTDDIAPTPATLQAQGKDYIQGLARRGIRLLILLDMKQVLGADGIAAVTVAHSKETQITESKS